MLQQFSARNNQFTGPIPNSLKNCSSLTRVRLEQNNLTGNITDDFERERERERCLGYLLSP
jgi:hypothetical protein